MAIQAKPNFKQARARRNVETIDSVSAWMKRSNSPSVVVASRQQTAELSALYAIAACAGGDPVPRIHPGGGYGCGENQSIFSGMPAKCPGSVPLGTDEPNWLPLGLISLRSSNPRSVVICCWSLSASHAPGRARKSLSKSSFHS
jgi:hypothetical protein